MSEQDPAEDPLQDFLHDAEFDEFIPVDNFFHNYVGALPQDQPGGTCLCAIRVIQLMLADVFVTATSSVLSVY